MRKLVEDGVRHPRWRGSDRSIRTLINTIYTRTYDSRSDSFISEDLRYDLDWFLERIVDYTKFDVSLIVKRLKRWERSTEKMYLFYISLLEGRVIIDGKEIDVKDFLDGMGRSRQILKDFVYAKQAEVYAFWAKQKKIDRVMYVMDTIILNEVGGTTDPGDLEKKEVLKVVLNRSELKYYSSISSKDTIYKFINKEMKSQAKVSLVKFNVERRRVSFTYYFLDSF